MFKTENFPNHLFVGGGYGGKGAGRERWTREGTRSGTWDSGRIRACVFSGSIGGVRVGYPIGERDGTDVMCGKRDF